jgi:4-carboxymuconolactone decarboxylase
VPYVGFPAVASATTAVVEVLRELGLDTETKTAEERGLL